MSCLTKKEIFWRNIEKFRELESENNHGEIITIRDGVEVSRRRAGSSLLGDLSGVANMAAMNANASPLLGDPVSDLHDYSRMMNAGYTDK